MRENAKSVPPAKIIRHESDVGRWEMIVGAPAQALRPYVREYIGFVEHTSKPICRREVPTEVVPVIVNFGAPIRVFDQRHPGCWTDSLSAGVHRLSYLVMLVRVT